jgi:mono/diheme cytochrome c family protein
MLEVKAPGVRGTERVVQSSEAELMARLLYGRDLAVPIAPQALVPSDEEVTALLAYLQRLPAIPWVEIRQGQDLYDALCVHCHGLFGRGDGLMAPQLPTPPRDLSAPALQQQLSDADMVRVIADGKGVMPGMRELISVSDIQGVVAFVRLLSPAFEQYSRLCAACHGPDGRPPAWVLEDTEDEATTPEIPTVVFNQTYFRLHSAAHVRDGIRHMLTRSRAVMPHFAAELSQDEIRHIIAYLQSPP